MELPFREPASQHVLKMVTQAIPPSCKSAGNTMQTFTHRKFVKLTWKDRLPVQPLAPQRLITSFTTENMNGFAIWVGIAKQPTQPLRLKWLSGWIGS